MKVRTSLKRRLRFVWCEFLTRVFYHCRIARELCLYADTYIKRKHVRSSEKKGAGPVGFPYREVFFHTSYFPK